VVQDGANATPGSSPLSDTDRRRQVVLRRKLLGLGLLGFLLVIGGLLTLVYGTIRAVEARHLEEFNLVPAGIGLACFAVGLALLQASYLRQRKGEANKPVPWLTLLISCVGIAAVLGIAIFSVADAFLPRPEIGQPCPEHRIRRAVQLGANRQPVAFAFPEETAGTTGLRISMGRGRPERDSATQVLVRSVSTRRANPTADETPRERRRRLAAAQARARARARARNQRDDDVHHAIIRLGGHSRVQVVLTELRREDGARMVDGSVSAWAEMVNLQNMKITLCVAPRAVEEVDSGTYTGVLTVVDPRIARFDVPVRVEMQFNRWPVLVTLLIGTLIVAAFVLFNGTKQLAGETAGLHPQTLRDFGVWATGNPVAIGTGVVAAVAIFANQYLADAGWSGTSAEVFALIGAFAAAFLGAATVAAGVGPKKARETRNEQDGLTKEAVPDRPSPTKPADAAAKRKAKRRRQRERARQQEAERAGAVVPPVPAATVPAPAPVPRPRPLVHDEDDDTLGHPDDAEMPTPEEDHLDAETALTAGVIPSDDDVAGGLAADLEQAEETGEAASGPDEVIPSDEAVSGQVASTLGSAEETGEAASGPDEVIPSDDEVGGQAGPVEGTGEAVSGPDEVIPSDDEVGGQRAADPPPDDGPEG
jgi:hypothetical protein